MNSLIHENGTIEQEQSFDAWSLSDCWRRNRRDPNTWQNLTSAPAGLITDCGYTGHLHLDGFKLINMNGRIYDPVLGRFLSPDNFVQDPGSTQDYNRYSYCGNNPLIYTDPSGYIRIPQTPAYDNGNDHPGGASGSGDYSIYGKYGTIFPYGLDCGAGAGIISSDPAGIYGYYYDYNSGTYVDKATGKTVDYQTAQGYTINRAKQLGEYWATRHYWEQSSFVDNQGVINIVGEKCYYANSSLLKLYGLMNPSG